MAQAVTIKVEGLDKLLKKLDGMPKKLTVEVKGELLDSGLAIAEEARRLAPGDKGFLRGGIGAFEIGPLTVEYVSRMDYSAYVEFGTGKKVRVPAGLENYAMQFKGAGVKEVNLPARPFFFPPYLRERPEIVKRIKEIIANL